MKSPQITWGHVESFVLGGIIVPSILFFFLPTLQNVSDNESVGAPLHICGRVIAASPRTVITILSPINVGKYGTFGQNDTTLMRGNNTYVSHDSYRIGNVVSIAVDASGKRLLYGPYLVAKDNYNPFNKCFEFDVVAP